MAKRKANDPDDSPTTVVKRQRVVDPEESRAREAVLARPNDADVLRDAIETLQSESPSFFLLASPCTTDNSKGIDRKHLTFAIVHSGLPLEPTAQTFNSFSMSVTRISPNMIVNWSDTETS